MQGSAVRTVTSVRLPLNEYGYLIPPHRAWRYPSGGLVRVRVPTGAVDFTQEAVESIINIACAGRVQIEGPDPILNYELARAVDRQMRPCCGGRA